MKRQKLLFAALGGALFFSLGGDFVTPATAQFSGDQQLSAIDPATVLSPQAVQIVNMAASGASDDDLLSFIGNYPSMFGLTAQGIIYLQGLGISSTVTLAILNHDWYLNNTPNALPPIPLASPENQPQILPPASFPDGSDPPPGDAYPPESDPSLSALDPYGSWDILEGSGWCWQPSSWLGYFSYPWGLSQLQNGCWWRHPTCGWLWFPNPNLYGFQNYFVVQDPLNAGQIMNTSPMSIGQVNHGQMNSHHMMKGASSGTHHGGHR